MSFLDRQQAGTVIGKIWIGTSVPQISAKGNAYRQPQKLETFRLTSRSQSIIKAAAELFGGTIAHEDRVGWEVVTQAAELPVMVPRGQIIFQRWELYKGNVCERACAKNEAGEQICTLPDRTTVPCLCPPEGPERIALAAEGKACKPTTRLLVMIPDLPDLGVWRLTSRGYDAAAGLEFTADFLAKARSADVLLPARLWMDTRTKVKNGQTYTWQVPMLSLQHSMRQLAMMGGGQSDLQAMMPPEPRLAIAGGSTVFDGETDDVSNPPNNIPTETNARAAHAQAWAGPVVTPPASEQQAVADRAFESVSVPLVRALKNRSSDKGWDDDMVTIDGADEPLGAFLAARLEELEQAAAAAL